MTITIDTARDTRTGGDPAPGRFALEQAFGDPWDEANPTGFAATVAADERRELPGEALLDTYGVSAEFVPAELGGRFTTLDRLTRIMRTVWRHDPSLGLSAFASGATLWSAGSPEQRLRIANVLLANGKVASTRVSADLGATRRDAGWVLDGRTGLVANLDRADAMMLLARTGSGPVRLLIPRPDNGFGCLPRIASSGLRGVPLSRAEFRDCPAGPDALVGSPETTPATLLVRATLPAMALGCVDTGLRVALTFATERKLYGDRVIALPAIRAALADAFTDLLIADAFCTTVASEAHRRPGRTVVHGPALHAFVARQLLNTMDDLGSVLGAQSYLREGRHAIFQKLARDLPAALAFTSRAACRRTVLPHLAGEAWWRGEPEAERLSRLEAAAPLLAELRRLRERCARLRPEELTADAPAAAVALVDRYAAVQAAASCLDAWSRHRHDPFLGADLWVTAALHRLTERLGLPPVLSEPRVTAVREALLREALARHGQRRAFDLDNHPLPG